VAGGQRTGRTSRRDRRSDGDWTGTPGGASRTAGTGYTREFAFETPGSYEYYCSVPRANGVAGPFTVIEQ